MRMTRIMLALGICVAMAGMARAALPPAEAEAKARIEKSPRHGEFVDIQREGGKPLRAYVVYPERKDKAPVVMVIQEIFGLSDWIRSVADQLAADGFIAIAPDFLSGMGENGGGTESFKSRDDVTRAVRGVKPDDVVSILNATREYGLKLPSANGKVGTIGFCWGGGSSFLYATRQPKLNAAVIYYGMLGGGAPSKETAEKVMCPVAGFYGGNDNRISATVPDTEKMMKEAGKQYQPHVYEGAGHGFLRQQTGANAKAAEQAWPATVEFLKKNLEG